MKKTKTASPKPLPADFSVSDAPEIKTPVTEGPIVENSNTKEDEKTDESSTIKEDTELAPLPVPEIDKDAQLKIDEVQMQPEELPEQEKKGKTLFIVGTIIAIFILAGAIVLSVVYLNPPKEKAVVSEPTPTPTVVSETPKPILIKSNFTFEILNASGVSGQAGKTKVTIEGLGYTVTSIGNANSRETETKLLLKSNLVDQKDLVLTDLQKTFPDMVYAGEFDSETATARIILGE